MGAEVGGRWLWIRGQFSYTTALNWGKSKWGAGLCSSLGKNTVAQSSGEVWW